MALLRMLGNWLFTKSPDQLLILKLALLAVLAMAGEEERHKMNLLGTFYFPKKLSLIYKHLILSKNSTTIQLFAPLFA